MENLSEISGYAASTLVLFTFVAKDMRHLRTIATQRWHQRDVEERLARDAAEFKIK